VSPTFAIAIALSLAAKPVAKTYRGPLDSVDVIEQSASVLAKFDGVDKEKATQIVDASARALGLLGAMRVSFIRTPKATLATFVIIPEGGRLSFGRYSALAKDLSARVGVEKAWAVIAPGPRDVSLEGEAVFAFAHGQPGESNRLQYRDDAKYLEMVRRRSTGSAWRLSRWPAYPLSALAAELGLPGRSCLDQPWQQPTLATEHWPDDAGENLALAWVDLPGGMATEILQLGLREKKSASSEVADALAKAREAQVLGHSPDGVGAAPYDDGQPDSEKHARRTLTLYLPAQELEAADDAGAGEAESLSRVVQHAWRRAHPFEQSR
jgi:hypothetical protein